MNKFYIPLISLAAVAIGIGCISSTSSNPAEAAPSQSSTGFSTVLTPDIPKTVTICGQEVSLDREDMYERYDRELASIVYTHGNTLLTLKRANKYFPVMAPILKKNGIPEDFLYLACIESYLNPKAVSPAKAAGIWQFIPETGKQYGLEVSDEVDERYNLEKATASACRYLKQAYNKYGNWESVMAAFNGGQARISKELDAQLVDSAFDLWLADETMRYIFRIMAMKEVMENPSKYGFSLRADQLYQPAEYDIVEVSGPIDDWPAWAMAKGISYAQLRDANQWIRSKKLTNKAGKTYQVKIPKKASISRSKQTPTVYNPNWVR
ncbi:MAG: lytic transglycosylase domain-containing protein [Bacteroidales bacterium]|nr:lytic transglycosylase domain-containing protein [Bacteroidales bacterium]